MTTSSKASALAHPIQGLIKYHGLQSEELRIPFQDSISVCVAPYVTHTTVEFSDHFSKDQVEIDGKIKEGREKERVLKIIDYFRKLSKNSLHFHMQSKNNFISNIGLGASSSGFAALTKATADALHLNMTLLDLSKIARLGAGSASRALTGSFSYWYAGDSHETSYSKSMIEPSKIPLKMLIVEIPAFKQTENAHREAVSSPLFQSRLEYAKNMLKEMTKAIQEKNLKKIGELAETDTLNLHAITMTGAGNPIYWRPETLQVMLEVRKMRQNGLFAYFSIDTGATIYINTTSKDIDEVEKNIQKLELTFRRGKVGGPVQSTNKHLF